MKKVFDEKLTIATYEFKFGADSPVRVHSLTKAWFASKRQVLVIEHTAEIEGAGHSYLDSKVREHMSNTPEFKCGAPFFISHLKTVSTASEAIRLAIKSADDYGIKIGEFADAAWKAVEAAQNEAQEQMKACEKRNDERMREEEETRIAAGHIRHTSWPCLQCGAMDATEAWCPRCPPQKVKPKKGEING